MPSLARSPVSVALEALDTKPLFGFQEEKDHIKGRRNWIEPLQFAEQWTFQIWFFEPTAGESPTLPSFWDRTDAGKVSSSRLRYPRL